MSSHPIIIKCPHCEQLCEIVELNCRIFRCGILKSDGKQIHPHAPKQVCDDLKSRNLIFGCGKPFQVLDGENKTLVVVVCDYI